MVCLLVTAVVALVISLASDVISSSDPGTTPHLEDIFIGRCWDYRLIKYKQQTPTGLVSCTDLWNAYFEAFAHKAPCDVAMEDYLEFMNDAKQDLASNQAMFWSGTYVIAHEYAQDSRRFTTLEDTLIGYLANSVIWCGSASDASGLNMTRCPAWTDCPLESSESFWAAASQTFAASAKGEVTLMLDGSRDGKPAYSKQSFFAKYELPNLPSDVTKVNIIVTHALGAPFKETCNNGSLLQLEADIKQRDFPLSCVDDPPSILHLLCAADPTARECQLAQRHLFPQRAATRGRHIIPFLLNSKPDRFNY